MVDLNSFYVQWSPRILSILRIVTAILFIEHGTFKLFNYPLIREADTPPLLSLLGIAGLLEFFGGLLILLGLFTRPTAFILAGEMAVAYFLAHAPHAFWPAVNRGELAALYCFVFLYLAVAGGGSWSLDYLWLRSETPPAIPTPPHTDDIKQAPPA
jgi:putative oxidoreductase